MTAPSQQIRFCRSRDGTQIAYTSIGVGPALLWVGHFSRHLEHDWGSPIWRPWLSFLSRRHRLIRYDLRGCGLSDREVSDFSLQRLAEDFAAVADAAVPDAFSFFGMAGNVVAGVNYAVEHPDRVSRLILYGCHTRGPLVRDMTAAERAEAETRLKAIEFGWPDRNPAFGQFFTSLHAPDAPSNYIRAYNELVRSTTTATNATNLIRAYWHADLRQLAPRVTTPTLIVHSRGDPIIPFQEGRLGATLIPGARFLPLDSRNHVLVDTEAAWGPFVAEVEEFLPAPPVNPARAEDLTARQREVLDLVARGLDNRSIAARLKISEKTVRNHVTIILETIGAKNRTQAVIRAREAGLGL
jgi:pimeloyl-ACP methyl ester carboxylesterase